MGKGRQGGRERGREEGRDVWKDSLVGLVVTAMAGGRQAAHTGTGHPPQLVYPASCLSSTRCGQMLALSVPAGAGLQLAENRIGTQTQACLPLSPPKLQQSEAHTPSAAILHCTSFSQSRGDQRLLESVFLFSTSPAWWGCQRPSPASCPPPVQPSSGLLISHPVRPPCLLPASPGAGLGLAALQNGLIRTNPEKAHVLFIPAKVK